MKLGKTFLFSTVLAAGAGLAMGATDAHASETYTVESGDTLSKISHKFAGNDSLVDSIAKANKISNVNMIFAGQKLTIDGEAKAEKAQETAPVQAEASAQQTQAAPVQQQAAPVQETAPAATTSSAKEWIAQRESGGSYSATNGQYIGRYQLSASYLNGDYSAENQERVADQYVTSRYGSWEGAQSFWQANGWY